MQLSYFLYIRKVALEQVALRPRGRLTCGPGPTYQYITHPKSEESDLKKLNLFRCSHCLAGWELWTETKRVRWS
jgi:hypothetical protein